jgi:peptide/nickel transport system permease protein
LLKYAFHRILAAIPTLFIVAIVVFLLMRAIPGDPVLVMLGDLDDPNAYARMHAALGLDRPMFVQFWDWLARVASGDLGVSLFNKEPVLDAILSRFAVTAQVVFLATFIAAAIAVPAGLVAAYRQNSAVDAAMVTGAALLVSIPSFWVGLMLILVFGVKLGWLPTFGFVSVAANLGTGILYLLMPVGALVMTEIAIIVRMMRSSAIEVMRKEYITHAQAKGLSPARVLFVHALPSAFTPVLSVIGILLGQLLGGAAVIETVFTLPGVGRLLVESILQRDYPVVQGCLLFVAAIYVVVNLATDLLYPLFDPRVKL